MKFSYRFAKLDGYNVPVPGEKSEFLKVRITEAEKTRFTALAKREGLSLSGWIRRNLLRAEAEADWKPPKKTAKKRG